MKTFFNWLRKVFVSGMVVLVPIIGTIWLLKVIIQWMDGFVVSVVPEQFQPEVLFGRDIPGIGIITTIVLILLMGLLTRFYIGRWLVGIGDRIIAKIPLGRSIYSAIKQFMDAVSGNHDNLRHAVAVEYPRRGSYVIGFLTSEALERVAREGDPDERWVNVFVPTTPNPTSGFLVMVPEKDVVYLKMSVDEAFRLLISGGLVQNKRSIQEEK